MKCSYLALLVSVYWAGVWAMPAWAKMPQIFSSNLVAENYVSTRELTAKIIIIPSATIQELWVNGEAQPIPEKSPLILELPLQLHPGENRLVIRVKDRQGESSEKTFVIEQGPPEGLAAWQAVQAEKAAAPPKALMWGWSSAVQHDDNTLLIPLSESRRVASEKSTYAWLNDFQAEYTPWSRPWRAHETSVTPVLSYRFQSQWNSTAKASGYLSHWLGERLDGQWGDHAWSLGLKQVALRTDTASGVWEDLAQLNVIEAAGLWHHSSRWQSYLSLHWIDHNFEDQLELAADPVQNHGHDLDGHKLLVTYGAIYQMPWAQHQMNLYGVYLNSDTRQDHEDFLSRKAWAEYRWQEPQGSGLSIRLQEEHQDYQASDPQWGKARQDTYRSLSLDWRYPWRSWWEWQAGGSRIWNFSNLRPFRYERNLIYFGFNIPLGSWG